MGFTERKVTNAELIKEATEELQFFRGWDHDGSHTAEGERMDGIVYAENALMRLGVDPDKIK